MGYSSDCAYKEASLKMVRFPSFEDFASVVINSSDLLPGVILGSLIYVDRLKKRLSSKTCGNRETIYRVFVTSLIISSKMLNDGAPNNTVWATTLLPWFNLREINTMERQFLQFIDYDLGFESSDLEDMIQSDPKLRNVLLSASLFAPKSHPRSDLTMQDTETLLHGVSAGEGEDSFVSDGAGPNCFTASMSDPASDQLFDWDLDGSFAGPLPLSLSNFLYSDSFSTNHLQPTHVYI